MCGIFTAIYKNKDKLNLDFCNSSIDQLKKGVLIGFSKTIGKIFWTNGFIDVWKNKKVFRIIFLIPNDL